MKTDGDFYTLTEIRWMLREVDGVVEVVSVQPELKLEPLALLVFSDASEFPDRAFAEALRVAPVIVENGE